MTISFRIKKKLFNFLEKNLQKFTNFNAKFSFKIFLIRLDRNQPSKSFWPSKCIFAKIQLMQKIID